MDNAKLKTLLLSGEEICLKVKGISMEPFLKDGEDSVFLINSDKHFRTGDIYFFEDKFGRIIMHRLQKITKDGCFFRGDALNYCEGPIPPENVFAKVVKIKHNGKFYQRNSMYFVWHRIIIPKKFAVKSYIHVKLPVLQKIFRFLKKL